jgi:hypothetical protein
MTDHLILKQHKKKLEPGAFLDKQFGAICWAFSLFDFFVI